MVNMDLNAIVLPSGDQQGIPLMYMGMESGSIRMGVSEMTRFGMGPEGFTELAQLMADVIQEGKTVRPEIKTLRGRFEQMQYCFTGKQVEGLIEQLHQAL